MKNIMKNKRKAIIGAALLTSLSIFAGTTIAANNNQSTTGDKKAIQTQPLNCPEPGHKSDRQNKQQGQPPKDRKRMDPKTMEEIKTKLKNNKKLTKSEATELLEFLESKPKGARDGMNRQGESVQPVQPVQPQNGATAPTNGIQ